MVSRTALVIVGDELFRFALVGLLKVCLNYSSVIDGDTLQMPNDTTLGASPIDLVLIEAQHVLGGGNRLAQLQQQYPGTRVVVVSQCARRDDVLEALRAGAHGFVPKTASVADMVSALTLILSGSLWIPGAMDDDRLSSSVEINPIQGHSFMNVQHLTPRQREVLRYIVQGKSNKEIARLMSLGEGTVKVHVAGLLRTLGAPNRSRAAAIGSGQILSPL